MNNFEKYSFKFKLKTNLTTDIKEQNIDFEGYADFLDHVVKVLNDVDSWGYNKIKADSDNWYMIDFAWETDHADIFVTITIYDSCRSNAGESDPEDVAEWLKDMYESKTFPLHLDAFIDSAFSYASTLIKYPVCTGWKFAKYKFINSSGESIPMHLTDTVVSRDFTVTEHVFFDQFTP